MNVLMKLITGICVVLMFCIIMYKEIILNIDPSNSEIFMCLALLIIFLDKD